MNNRWKRMPSLCLLKLKLYVVFIDILPCPRILLTSSKSTCVYRPSQRPCSPCRKLNLHSALNEFLRHLATLLTCGSSKDPCGAQAIAITGTIEQNGVKVLVVTESAAAKESIQAFFLKGHKIEKSSEPFDAIISGPASVSLRQHIIDLLCLLPSCDRAAWDHIESLTTFVTMRSLHKLFSRLTSDKKVWKTGVTKVLKDWKPAESDDPFESSWVKKPQWAIHTDRMQSKLEKRGESEEWLFSTNTIGVWANTLGAVPP
ncbi:unnamed protein product [Cyclocybe aegerita]|uniref:Uncharacterized protein n=1 Tax=Cyclocybe aegerita TaxID=1973307 RepID=A0A8S0WB39_CYCAE|nr:unnamed protein product [Cyclocybe aegerita]